MSKALPTIWRVHIALTAILLQSLLYSFCCAQPGPIDTLRFTIPAGTTSLPTYTPFAMSYYPFYNGVANDSVHRIVGDQVVGGALATADRVMDLTAGGFAYRTSTGEWTGSLRMLRNCRAFAIMNRHDEREIILVGVPADTLTYVSPMPGGAYRTAGPRMLTTHPIDSVGLITYGFHKTQNMKAGGDLIIDMVTRKIARCDSSAGWIGTMEYLIPGQPVIIQTNHTATFDWIYGPGLP